MKSGIYKIVNTLNNKIYIGSAVNIKQRWYKHISTLNFKIHHNKHLQSAWVKYKNEAFKFEVIEHCENACLIEREQYWIDLLNPQYNKRKDAKSNLGFKHSEESKLKSSISNTGKKHNIDLDKVSKIRSRENLSEETLAKMAKSSTGRKLSQESKNKISEALKLRVRKAETYEKISLKVKGQKRTLEQKMRMSEGRFRKHGIDKIIVIQSEAVKKK